MNHVKTADTISVSSHCIDENTNLIYLDCFIELVSVIGPGAIMHHRERYILSFRRFTLHVQST